MAAAEPNVMGVPNEWERAAVDATIWHLLVMEDTNNSELHNGTRITGQFPIEKFTHELASNVPDASGFSRANPLIQWVGGTVETLSFQARLFSLHSEDFTARDKFEILKLLRQPHEPLNRPPLTRFFWGNAIPGGMPCFVQSLGGVEYDEIRSDGSIRGLSLSITLKKWTSPIIDRTVVSPTERTPIHVVKHGETYEMIAYRRYGDPSYGIPLRQLNPRFPMERWAPKSIADLNHNETIKLYPKRDLTEKGMRPESHIFDPNNRVAADNRRYFFMTRASKTAILPKK